MKILGISGHKGSGKTTVANHIQTEASMFRYGFFAGAKRLYCQTMDMGLEPTLLDRKGIKDSLHQSGKTRRQMLQEYGCAMRAIHEDVWVQHWKDWVNSLYAKTACGIIADDVRFENEVAAIHDLGGKVIRLTRTPFPDDKHESETALDLMELRTKTDPAGVMSDCAHHFDAIIDNANMTVDECNKAVLEMVTERGWV